MLQALHNTMKPSDARIQSHTIPTQSRATSLSNSETKRNVIVTGITESRHVNLWSEQVSRAPQIAAGREIIFDDAFRNWQVLCRQAASPDLGQATRTQG
jgi:hypothetical protein